ncbi:MAG: hypothetical protein LBQ36_05815, partial [Synergistaceae bacterium]|nr:hypothetical protein [Synergistaceae bacterium]
MSGEKKRSSALIFMSFLAQVVLALLIGQCALPRYAHAGGKFAVREFFPQGQVTEPGSIRVEFTTPVVMSDDIGKTVPPGKLPLTFSPRIEGLGKWTTPTTFTYQLPSGMLPQTTGFEALISGDLKDLKGNKITGNKKFAFNTPPLEFIEINQTNYFSEQGLVEYQLRFNAPVSYSTLQDVLTVTDERGGNVPHNISNVQGDVLQLRVSAEDGSPIKLNIPPGLTSLRGPLAMKNAVSVKAERDLTLKVLESSATHDYYSGSAIYLRMTSDVDIDKAEPFVEVTPSRNLSLSTNGYGLTVMGDFPPRELVTVKLKAGLPPLEGKPLAKDWERSFIFPDLEPSVNFSTSGRFISPANEELIIPFSSVNIENFGVAVERVYDNNVTYATRNEWPYYVSELAEAIYWETFKISAAPNETAQYSIDLKKILNGRKGLFQITAGNLNRWPTVRRIINVTDIGGSAKIGDKTALIWANSIASGTPMKGVKASIYSHSNQLIASGVTDEHGVCSIKRDDDWENGLRPNLVVLESDGDVSVLHLESNIWAVGNADYSGTSYLNGKYQGICYTPRGIFRPGETVPLLALIRTADLTPETPFPVQLKVFTSMGREWTVKTVMTSEMGMAATDIQLSDAAPTGDWHAYAYIPGESEPITECSFIVEDFAPPKINVEVSSDVKELRYGESPNLHVFAEYLFGAPGDGLNYEIETSFIPKEYANPDWPDYSFSDHRISFTSSSNIEASGILSSDGTADVAMPEVKNDAPSMLDAIYRVGVREDGGRWVYKSVSIPYYPRDTLLGIKKPDFGFTTGRDIPFAFAAIDTAGKPASPEGVTLTVYRQQSRRIITTVDGKRRSEYRNENVPLKDFDKKPITFKDGRAEASVSFGSNGYYVIAIEGAEGEARASASFYVYNPAWRYEGMDDAATLPESLSVTLDKDTYRVGERATATVSGSFEGTVLISVETDSVLHYDTSTSGGKSAQFTFDVTPDMAPNAWVSAHLVRAAAAEDTWSGHRAFGAAPIKVDCSDIKLGIEVSAPEKIRPSETNEFSIQLKDSVGNGVPGEASIMLADEGVLALTRFKTPNFYEKYTAKRRLTLSVYDIYAELMPLYLKTPAVLTPGGGDEYAAMPEMMKASLSPVRADRFKVLTICKTVATDENGRANFTMDIPEFAGRARLMVMASSKRAFGSAEGLHAIARDVVTDVTLPRALAPQDIFESQIQLFNRTGQPIEANVRLDISGPLQLVTVSGKQWPDAAKKSHEVRVSMPKGEKPFVIPLTIKAADNSGVATITLATRYQETSQEQTLEIAVRPPYPRMSKTGAATVKPGESAELKLPSDWFPGTRRATVSMSGMPMVNMADAANFLISYPYYCLEQTVSRGWAMLALPDLVSKIDPRLASRENMEYEMSRVLMRIQSMQYYGGGFSLWNSGDASNWISAYVTHFLVMCEKEGLQVSASTLRSSLEFLRFLLTLQPDSSNRHEFGAALSVRAYASYVLALKGEAPMAWMSYIKDNIESMPHYGRIMLAAAYAAAHDPKTAEALLGENAPPQVKDTGMEQPNFDSPLRTKALYLTAWNELDPTSPGAVAAATELLEMFRSAP